MEKSLAEIVLVNSKNQILLQHRTQDAPTFPNMYCIFGGKIEKGEKPIDAVKRECYEELEYKQWSGSTWTLTKIMRSLITT